MPHLFLDLDNTLVGTEDLVLPVFLTLLKKDYGLDVSEDAFYERFLGKAGKDLYRAISAHYGVILDEDGLLQKQIEANHAAILETGFTMAEGMIECLTDLQSRGWTMTIVSNSADDKIRLTLDNISGDDDKRLKALVEGRVISCNDRQKPDPYGYLKALELTGAQAGRDTIFCIEDSGTGARAGLAAGLPVLGFTGFSRNKDATRQNLLAIGCAAVFDHWADLPAHLPQRAA